MKKKRMGRPTTIDADAALSLKLPQKTLDACRAMAAKRGESLSDFLRAAILARLALQRPPV